LLYIDIFYYYKKNRTDALGFSTTPSSAHEWQPLEKNEQQRKEIEQALKKIIKVDIYYIIIILD